MSIQVPVAIYKSQEIHISEYDHKLHKGNIFCPVCSGALIYVNGSLRRESSGVRMHFRHREAETKTQSIRTDATDRDCLWHKWSQQVFPKRYREKIFHISNNKKIIADIMFDSQDSIEFQNSKITPNNIKIRESNYPSMVWVVNGTRNRFHVLGNGYYLMKMNVSNRWWLNLDDNRVYIDTGFDGAGAIMRVMFFIKSGWILLMKIGNYRDLVRYLGVTDFDMNEIIIDYTGKLLEDRLTILSKREKCSGESIGFIDVVECHYKNRRLALRPRSTDDVSFWKQKYFKQENNLLIYDESIVYPTDISYESRCRKITQAALFYEIGAELIHSTGDYLTDLMDYAKRYHLKLTPEYIDDAISEHSANYILAIRQYYSDPENLRNKWQRDNKSKIMDVVAIINNINNMQEIKLFLSNRGYVYNDHMLSSLLAYRDRRITQLLSDYFEVDDVRIYSINERESVTFINTTNDVKYTCPICQQLHRKKRPVIYYKSDYKLRYKCTVDNESDIVGTL